MFNRSSMPQQVSGAFGPTPKAKKKAKPFKPGGTPGKLHREIGVPVGQKIPPAKLASAANSNDPEIRRDAIRAKTMAKWKKPGRGAF
jgi:hypothetical protein